jgi:hypothetical protein
LLTLIAQESAVAQTPYSAPLATLVPLLQDTVATLSERGNAADNGAYALLQLSGCVVHAWNGHALYAAAGEGTDYQQRLRAALELHAGSCIDTARLWAGKALQTLPALRFS